MTNIKGYVVLSEEDKKALIPLVKNLKHRLLNLSKIEFNTKRFEEVTVKRRLGFLWRYDKTTYTHQKYKDLIKQGGFLSTFSGYYGEPNKIVVDLTRKGDLLIELGDLISIDGEVTLDQYFARLARGLLDGDYNYISAGEIKVTPV